MKFEFEAIGFIQSNYEKKYDAPRQPHVENAKQGRIVLEAHKNFEMALSDLDGFSHIWLVYVFDKNKHWKPKVLPPRNIRKKKGVFATRSPYRPNPIGISVVKLIKISGKELFIEDHDLLDGTPILDIKPYLPYSDSHVDVKAGWIDELVEIPFEIVYENETLEKLEFLEENHVFFKNELEKRLSYDPFPHPYRRITKEGDGFKINYQEWMASFRINEQKIYVNDVFSAFNSGKLEVQHENSLHKFFYKTFGKD
jgi:tRNA-Thr(GGU) m(6)t(6)A37 methyltransferase TsaA